MNRSFFPKTKYIIGVGLKKTGSHTGTKLTPKLRPEVPAWELNCLDTNISCMNVEHD